ncbi:MAG: lipid-A-disaccharide synthase [Gammaproteobacteria bacterium]|nr:lipid-A-disaccharide synthase [Gammaproteobacteria bacterium]|tara:strand:- start:503 stop:1645 length:1143 start_codon:yes stop_codon:yes gene_type:complete
MNKFVIVAGESSGDLLGSRIIASIKDNYPDATFKGIAGPKMIQSGCKKWFSSSELSVMGIFGVLKHLSRILKIRKKLTQKILEDPPDAFIGIDAPDFNLKLEEKLKHKGIKTIHVVSPSFWAWRENRVKSLNQSTDLLLCLFPFEEDLLKQHDVNAVFIGHPLADSIQKKVDVQSAKNSLDIKAKIVVALMPGSRSSEINRHAKLFFKAAELLNNKLEDIEFVIPVVDSKTGEQLQKLLTMSFSNLNVKITDSTHSALSASDLVITKSGTSTLEAALHKKPMVVVYKMSSLSYWFLKIFNIVQTEYIALPNILLGKKLVPELIQENASSKAIFTESLFWLSNHQKTKELQQQFDLLHSQLQQNASFLAASTIVKMLQQKK